MASASSRTLWPVTVPTDHPIRRQTEDALGRAPIAAAFARQVIAHDASQGLVVGVLGPWGNGKTSFVNLARDEFKAADAEVLDFNPWMFSGAQQLVESFFAELSSQLKLRPGLADIADEFADYGEAFSSLVWLPFVGPWVERGRGLAKGLGQLLKRRREGTSARRTKLTMALAALDTPIVVVLDDIDRLSTAEIRDVFKLVRPTASFPNIVYVMAFDRDRVEKALTEDGISGRDYLEKILQVAVDLPTVPAERLDQLVFSALDAAVEAAGGARELDGAVWPDVYMEIIRPLIKNMRDVRRLAAGSQGTVASVGDQIALADLLALEAVRIFLPSVFAALPQSVEALTTAGSLGYGAGDDSAEYKSRIEALLAVEPEQATVVRALVDRLFYAARRHLGGSTFGPDWKGNWLRDRRVAHESILRLYLERVAGQPPSAFYDAERAYGRLGDQAALDAFLRSIDPERLEDVIKALENYDKEFRAEHVVPGVVTLWNIFPELPELVRGLFDLDSRLVVGRVTYRLLRSLDDESLVESAVREILPQLSSLTARFEVVSDVGYRDGAGHKLVSPQAATELEQAWRDQISNADPDQLAAEPELLRVLLQAPPPASEEKPLGEGEPVSEENADPADVPPALPTSPAVTLALLKSAKRETKSQTVGTRSVRHEPRLAWGALTSVFGDEEALGEHLSELRAAEDLEVDPELLKLVARYEEGWRPED